MHVAKKRKPVQQNRVALEPFKVISKSVKWRKEMISDDEKMSEHEETRSSKVAPVKPVEVRAEKGSSYVRSTSEVGVAGLHNESKDGQDATNGSFPIIRMFSNNKKADALLKKELSCTTLTLKEIGSAFPNNSVTRQEGTNSAVYNKPFTVRLGNLVDGHEISPIEYINQYQLSSPDMKISNEAGKYQFPGGHSSQSRTFFVSEGGNNLNKQRLTPDEKTASPQTKAVEDSQEKKVERMDMRMFDGISQLEQIGSPSEKTIKEQDLESCKPTDGIVPHKLRCPVSNASRYSSFGVERSSVLSIPSKSPSEVFSAHEALSIEDIFDITIENEISVIHDYLKPSRVSRRVENFPTAENAISSEVKESCSSSNKSYETDRNFVSPSNTSGGDVSKDNEYLKNLGSL